jgi:phosphoribosyl-AMP cyclohydrolase
MSNLSWLDAVKWDDKGLVTAIAQDKHSQRIMMVANVNRESLQLTADTGIAHYWSRSRNRLWKKGEESGHLQKVHGGKQKSKIHNEPKVSEQNTNVNPFSDEIDDDLPF